MWVWVASGWGRSGSVCPAQSPPSFGGARQLVLSCACGEQTRCMKGTPAPARCIPVAALNRVSPHGGERCRWWRLGRFWAQKKATNPKIRRLSMGTEVPSTISVPYLTVELQQCHSTGFAPTSAASASRSSRAHETPQAEQRAPRVVPVARSRAMVKAAERISTPSLTRDT